MPVDVTNGCSAKAIYKYVLVAEFQLPKACLGLKPLERKSIYLPSVPPVSTLLISGLTSLSITLPVKRVR